MDGWTFAAELRRRHGDEVPVVVCTAAEDTARRAREVGAVGALSKPFELDDLLRLVEVHTAGHAGLAGGPPTARA
jgi:CheY-like chemotaxis protein